MKIKIGETIEFVAISWDEGWDFDYPSALIYPIGVRYESGLCPEKIIEDICIDVCCEKELVTDNVYKNEGKSEFKKLKSVAKKRFNNNQNIWTKKLRELAKIKVHFFKNKDNEIDFRIIEKTIVV